MGLFGLGKKKADTSLLSDKNLFENIREQGVTESEDAASEKLTSEPTPANQDVFSALLPNVAAKENPFQPDVLSVQDELSSIKNQLKSMSLQLGNIIKMVEELEKKRMKNV